MNIELISGFRMSDGTSAAIKRWLNFRWFLIASLSVLFGCDRHDNYDVIECLDDNAVSVQISPFPINTKGSSALILAKGNTQPFIALATYPDGQVVNVTNMAQWISSHPEIISIDNSGIATLLSSAATIEIVACLGGVNSNSSTITGTTARLTKIQITPPAITLAKGLSQSLTAIGTYSDGTTANISSRVTWQNTSSNITISQEGLLTTIRAGAESTISASLSGITSNTIGIEVTSAVLEAIQVTPALVSIAKGNSQQLRAIGLYSDNAFVDLTNRVTWSSSVPKSISISKIGIAEGQQETSEAIVFASLESITSNRVNMTVTPATLTSIQITPNKLAVAKGIQQQMSAIGTYSDNTNADLTTRVHWNSTNTSGLTVDNLGLISTTNVANDIVVSAFLNGITSNQAEVDVTSAALQSIQITPASITLAKGLQQPLIATGTFSDNTSQNMTSLVAWESSNTAIATVGQNGEVEAVNEGMIATITATLDGIDSNLAQVDVTVAILESIQVTPAQLQLAKGNSGGLTATGIYSDKTSADLTSQVTWKSTNTSFATVTSKGKVTAINPTSSIKVSAALGHVGSNAASITITEAELEAIQVTPTSFSAAKGVPKQLAAIGIFSDNTKLNLTNSVAWSSRDNTIVTISPTGLAKGVEISNGIAITANMNGITSNTATMSILAAALESIQITPAIITVAKGLTQQLTAMGTYSDNTSANITSTVSWSSTDISNVTVTPTGLAHGVDITTDTEITANLDDVVSNSASVAVGSADLVSIQITPAFATLPEGLTQTLTATGILSDGTMANLSDKVTWVSANTSNVTVTPQGIARAITVSSGTRVTATLQGITSNSATIDVVDAVLTALQITPANSQLAKGVSQQLTAIGAFSDGNNANLTDVVVWKSSNMANVTVTENGLAKGVRVSAGTTITANLEKITSNTAIVDVIDATLTAIQITPANAIIAKGITTQLTATGLYTDATTANITTSVNWKSADTKRATVTPSGQVRGINVSNGTAVTASLDGVTSNTSAIVVNVAALNAIQITPSVVLIAKGQTTTFTAIGTYSDDTSAKLTEAVTWKVSAPEALTITTNGVANGVSVASDISVKANFQGVFSNSALVTVTAAVLTAIEVTPTEASIAKGQSQQMRANGRYSDGTTSNLVNNVNWLSTNTQAVTINEAGYITGINEATDITISASAEDITSDNALITVTSAVLTGITVTPTSVTIAKGLTQQLSAVGDYSDGTNVPISSDLSWASSNPRAVTVSSGGLITAIEPTANTNISVTFDGMTSSSVPIEVLSAALTSIDVIPASDSIAQGSTQQLSASGYYSDNSTASITENVVWKSANTANVTVSQAGVAAGVVQSDNTVITASLNNIISNDAEIDVTAPAVKIPVCGNKLNDTTSNNASGFCVKVTSDSRGNWFTSSPSLTVLQNIHFTRQNGTQNGVMTYSSTYSESHLIGPTGSFGLFDQIDGAFVGTNGQADRWCQHLASIKFAGQQNWTRPTIFELKYFNGVFFNFILSYGWPDGKRYWSSSFNSASTLSTLNLSVFDSVTSVPASTALYVTCISEP
ncbi:hypothetical protein A1OK_05085 [Enterovibrio norvegicus FF-454]|uniref:BIG2 domain-containing protein n=2 Tax=Enterovibrio norvegicus TaxID=188144 RepID=A0A1E5BXT3_9GAMM|nr:hypothetical protein A1OK_05085 [Enterovibrio norvegicus FF-454]